MAEGQNETTELLENIQVDIMVDPETGLQHYFVIDHNELDPNGEPVFYEVTATEYIEVKSKL
jgi:hypothetical protein